MAKKLYIFLLNVMLTSCSVFSDKTVDLKDIKSLPDDSLCIALRENNDNGDIVLKLYDEIQRRGAKINTERCYELEHSVNKNNGKISIEPAIFPSKSETIYDPKKGKYVTKETGPSVGATINWP